MIDLDMAKRLAETKDLKSALNVQLKKLNELERELEGQLLEQFADSPVDRISAFGKTFFVRRDVRVSTVELYDGEPMNERYERACGVLDDIGLSEFTGPRFHPQTLASYIRDLEKEGLPVPEQFEGAIKTYEIFKIGVRKAT